MKKLTLVIFLLMILVSCRKIDSNKTQQQLSGKWELITVSTNIYADANEELANFKSDTNYFDYLILYPESSNYTFYCHNVYKEPNQGIWLLNAYGGKNLTLNFQLMLSNFTIGQLNRLNNFVFTEWRIQKINNNKLVLTSDPQKPGGNLKNYKLTFIKTGKFE